MQGIYDVPVGIDIIGFMNYTLGCVCVVFFFYMDIMMFVF